MKPTTLLIIHPWLPDYRAPFFALLQENLADSGVHLIVGSSPAPPSIESRLDHHDWPWATPLKTHWTRIAGRDVAYRDVGRLIADESVGLVVVEQAIRNLETYPLLLRYRTGQFGLATWGHGRSYSSQQSRPEAHLKQFLTRQCDWFFAYTRGGAEHVISRGFPRDRTSVLNNSVDTKNLQADIAAISQADLAAYRKSHGLIPGRTALFMGGVDAAKGIPFLLRSAITASDDLPGFRLLVGGSGDLVPLVCGAEERGEPVRYVGRLSGKDKAMALAAADVLTIPQAIGLVAVDALAAGRIVVTTAGQLHGPEYEYLSTGLTRVVAPHQPAEYGRVIAKVLSDPRLREEARLTALRDARSYSTEQMVANFASGVCRWRELRSGARNG